MQEWGDTHPLSNKKGKPMNTTTVNQSTLPDPVPTQENSAYSRCSFIYPNGKRCSLPSLPAHSGFCRRHSRESLSAVVPVHDDSEDLSADLLPDLSVFDSSNDAADFLFRLLTLATKAASPIDAPPSWPTSPASSSNPIARSCWKTRPSPTSPTEIIFDMPRPNRDWPEPETKPRPENPTYADLRS